MQIDSAVKKIDNTPKKQLTSKVTFPEISRSLAYAEFLPHKLFRALRIFRVQKLNSGSALIIYDLNYLF